MLKYLVIFKKIIFRIRVYMQRVQCLNYRPNWIDSLHLNTHMGMTKHGAKKVFHKSRTYDEENDQTLMKLLKTFLNIRMFTIISWILLFLPVMIHIKSIITILHQSKSRVKVYFYFILHQIFLFLLYSRQNKQFDLRRNWLSFTSLIIRLKS